MISQNILDAVSIDGFRRQDLNYIGHTRDQGYVIVLAQLLSNK